MFAEKECSHDARVQQQHYDAVAKNYLKNYEYPHTEEYTHYLDKHLVEIAKEAVMDEVAEICCGSAEVFKLLKNRIRRGVGVDISSSMLEIARKKYPEENYFFIQGDATQLPLESCLFDSVFMMGGIHHVNNREQLFYEVFRILKPNGCFYWREPVNDFILWRLLRKIIYRLSPGLDYTTEHPLKYRETVLLLRNAGFNQKYWKTIGFLGFCLFMNSDILVFNRIFKYIPAIRKITRMATKFDEWFLRLPGMENAGLQVVGMAKKGPAIIKNKLWHAS